MWVGFIRGAFAVAGVFLGIVLVSNFRESATVILSEYVPNETLTAALGYAVTVGIAVAAAVIGAALLRTIAYRLFLGWMDRLAGLAVGLTGAAVISAAAVIGLAGLDYGNNLQEGGLAGTVFEKMPHAMKAREAILDSLSDSVLVSALADVTESPPDGALEKAPPDLLAAITYLDEVTSH
jgi:uncharacterized membrane protein required for colicin V production